MREGRFYPDHGLERIVAYHERQDARFAEAAAEISRRDRQADPHRDRAGRRRPGQPGPGQRCGPPAGCATPSANRAVDRARAPLPLRRVPPSQGALPEPADRHRRPRRSLGLVPAARARRSVVAGATATVDDAADAVAPPPADAPRPCRPVARRCSRCVGPRRCWPTTSWAANLRVGLGRRRSAGAGRRRAASCVSIDGDELVDERRRADTGHPGVQPEARHRRRRTRRARARLPLHHRRRGGRASMVTCRGRSVPRRRRRPAAVAVATKYPPSHDLPAVQRHVDRGARRRDRARPACVGSPATRGRRVPLRRPSAACRHGRTSIDRTVDARGRAAVALLVNDGRVYHARRRAGDRSGDSAPDAAAKFIDLLRACGIEVGGARSRSAAPRCAP